MKLLIPALLIASVTVAAKDAPAPAKVYIVHPTLVTDLSKEADFARDYLKRWAKSEIVLVDTPDGADVTVEMLRLDDGKGAGTETTQRGIFGGVVTTKADAPMTTAKVCLEKPSENCTELTKERLKMPDALKKFVKDNAKAITAAQ